MLPKFKNTIFYISVIGTAAFLMCCIINKGEADLVGASANKSLIINTDFHSCFCQSIKALQHELTNPLAIFILQVLTIIIVARFFSYICNKIGQPAVVGEIFAGIFLGPSILGYWFPDFSNFLFPSSSLENIRFLSQVGLILFMFIVGMELDIRVLKTKAHEALVISHVSMIFPFMLGTGLAYYTYSSYAGDGVNFLPFALFMGIAMSITAFPVLARIVQERELMRTPLGAMVITCAATDDISAWCVFAVVVAIAKAGSFMIALHTIFLAIIYVFLMIKVIRPFLQRFGRIYASKETMSKSVVAVFFVVLLLSAYTTEIIGIHAIFGAFMAGVIMPSNMNFRRIFAEKIEDVSLLLFLPLFFVFTGLRTQISFLDDSNNWQTCCLITGVAIAGKFLGSAIAAKVVGQSWRNSIIIGTLMNTRGLMELIILNIGYDLGIITPEIFAMMVIMALVTTFMASPILELVDKLFPLKISEELAGLNIAETSPKQKVLISFSNSGKGKAMLAVAKAIWGDKDTSYTALHVIPSEELSKYDSEEDKNQRFVLIKEESKHLNLHLNTILKITQGTVSKEILKQLEGGKYDFLILGIGSSVYQDTLLGRLLSTSMKIINPEKLIESFTNKEALFDEEILGEQTKSLISESKNPVGIFFNKELALIRKILVVNFALKDSFLLNYCRKIISNSPEIQVTVLDASDLLSSSVEFAKEIESFNHDAFTYLSVKTDAKLEKSFFAEYDLVLISYESWKKIISDHNNLWFAYAPSTLIIKPGIATKNK